MPPSSRRAVLQLAGATLTTGVAGCLSGTPQSTPSASPDANAPEGFWRWVTVMDSEQPPEQYSVEVSMEVVRPWITADQTANIEVTLTNHSEEPRELGPVVDGPDFPANNVEGIVLFDTTGNTRAQPLECINTDGRADEPVGYSGAQTPPHEIGAGESVTRRIGLLDDQNVRGCLPTGIYPFEITHLIRPVGEAEDGGPKDADTYKWSFRLGLRGDDG